MPARPETRVDVRTPAQWAALTSPVRVEIIEYLKLAGRSPVGRIADALGRAPDSLYFHLRKLTRAGIVFESAARSLPRRRAGAPSPDARPPRPRAPAALSPSRGPATFQLAADRIRLDYDARTGRNVPRLKRLVGAVFRMADRAFGRAIDADRVRLEGPRANAYVRRQVSWLTDADVARVLRHYAAIERILCAGQNRPAARPGGRFMNTAIFIAAAPRHRPAGAQART